MVEQKIVTLYIGYEKSVLIRLNREGWRAISITTDPEQKVIYALVEREVK